MSFLHVFSFFFHPKACPHLHSHISHLLNAASQKEIDNLVHTKDFLDNFINAYGTQKWCPHMTHILTVLNRFTFELQPGIQEKYLSFTQKAVPALVHVLERKYGGPIPTVTEISEDSDNLPADSDSD